MDDIVVRPITAADEQAVIALNISSVHFLSPMDTVRFHVLKQMAALHWVAERGDEIAAFIMAFTKGADYDSLNYRWFDRRLKDFLYIDRVVVSEKARSAGIGQRFYSEVEQWARSRGLSWLTAEVDIKPPNPGSLKFHKKQGFIEVARQHTGDGNKTVSLQVKSIKE